MGVVATIRMRWRLVLSLVSAIPIAVAVTLFLNDALGLEGEARELALGAPQAGVPIQLVLGLAMASITARELSRPFRTFTMRLADWPCSVPCPPRRLAVPGPVRRCWPPASPPGWCAWPSEPLGRRCRRTTSGSACATSGSRPLPWSSGPTGTGEAIGVDGSRLQVRAMGRDEWDTQFLVSLWRFLWYRNSGSSLHRSPRHADRAPGPAPPPGPGPRRRTSPPSSPSG